MKRCCMNTAYRIWGDMALSEGDTQKMEKCPECGNSVNIMIGVYDKKTGMPVHEEFEKEVKP